METKTAEKIEEIGRDGEWNFSILSGMVREGFSEKVTLKSWLSRETEPIENNF